MPRVLIVAASLLATAVTAVMIAGPAAADPPAPPNTPTSTSFAGVPTVGPIFHHGLAKRHSCTASVVASPTRNLILTAAHCVVGNPAGWSFVPGYNQGATPYGVWTVTAAYFDPHWLANQDTRYDYALLQVAPQQFNGRTRQLQDITGGNVLGVAPWPGQQITDIAYNDGIDDQPITCTIPTYRTQGYPAFNCQGYVGGSSGSPWLIRVPYLSTAIVSGVIGGLNQGGCYQYTSYTSPFTPAVYALLAQASAQQNPSIGPDPGGDGCPADSLA